MSVRLRYTSLILGVLLAGPCAAWSCQTARGGELAGVEPRYLVPCGRLVSISDRDEVVRGDCTAAPRSVPQPSCTACPAPAADAECCPCEACRGGTLARIRAAWSRWVQAVAGPKCECSAPCCEDESSCAARPVLARVLPRLLRETQPDACQPEGNPFRDDSVQAVTPPKDAAPKPTPADR